MDKSALFVSSAALALALCAGAPGATAACYPPAGASAGPPDCPAISAYVDANGNGQVVDAAHPLPTGTAVSAVVSGAITLAVTGLTTTSTSGIITSGNVWQNILAASPSRQGCLIVNTSSASGVVEQVSFTASGAAASGAAVFLAQYQRIDCSVGISGVRTDAISITSSASGSTASWAVLAN